MFIDIVCPHCSNTRRRQIELYEINTTEPKVFFCEEEGGGCGSYFVAIFKTQISVKTGKIEL